MAQLRVAHLRFLVPFVAIAWRATQTIGDNSFLWHVRAGTLQIERGQVLTADPFSFTEAGASWRTQSWLAELGYGWLEQTTGGIGWVPTMKFLAVSLTVGLVAMVVYRVSGRSHWVTLGALVLMLWQSSPFAVARPALLGFVLLACVIAIAHSQRRPLWALPLLFWLWASVHGMFVVGLGYLFLDAMRRRSRRQVVAVVAAGVATLFTAHGIGVWLILVQFLQNSAALDLIAEWHPPDFSNPFVVPLLLMILAVIVAGTRGALRPSDLWIVIPFVSFGVMAGRNVWPAVMVLLPIAVTALPQRDAGNRGERQEAIVINWAFGLVLVAVAVLGLVQVAPLSEELFPSREAMAEVGPGRLFNDTAVGGYLIYAAWPEREVFIDDRAELYGFEGLDRFHDLKSGVGVEETFAALDIEQAVVPLEWPLVGYLRLLGWETVYEDEYFAVLAE